MNEYLQDEREIKGYVDIQYSGVCNNSNQTYDYPQVAPISFPDNILSSSSMKIVKNYASLEEDYFLLDGSFVLPDYNYSTTSGNYGNIDSGYIADEISNNYSFYQLFERTNILDGTSTNMRGLTLYFKDNIPGSINIKITIYDTEQELNFNISDNIKSVVQIDFENDYLVKRIDYEFSNMEYSNRRLRIPYIEYGLGDILSQDNGNLISFNIVENVGELNFEFPSNQLTVNLYDEEDLFDINNPSGYADLLNNNVKIKPYIGILTQNNGVNYTNKGVYYLNSWNNDKNNITLSCEDYLNKLKNIYVFDTIGTVANQGNLEVYYRLLAYESDLGEQIGIDIYNLDYYSGGRLSGEYVDDSYIEKTNVFDYLQQLIIWLWGCLYCKSTMTTGSTETIDYIETYDNIDIYDYKLNLNTSLLDEPKYKIKEKLKSILIKKYSKSGDSLVTTDFIKNYNSEGKSIEIDNKFFKEYEISGTSAQTLTEKCNDICNKISSNYKKYDISINYTGDPNIKPNMIVPIETQYGEKQIKVLKHTLTFNGGLTGTIEGVGD